MPRIGSMIMRTLRGEIDVRLGLLRRAEMAGIAARSERTAPSLSHR
jgi:hypothetical protein